MIRNAVTYIEQAKRKNVTAIDVVYALKRQGDSHALIQSENRTVFKVFLENIARDTLNKIAEK